MTIDLFYVNLTIQVLTAICCLLLFIILISYIYDYQSNAMTILHIHLLLFSLLYSIAYFFYFKPNSYTQDNVPLSCVLQSSFSVFASNGQISVLCLIGFMMKKVFQNPQNIEIFRRINCILIIVLCYCIPGLFFAANFFLKGTNVDSIGYCRAMSNNYVIIPELLYMVIGYITFLFNMISLSTLIRRSSQVERESNVLKILTKIKNYNFIIALSCIKLVLDLSLLALYKINRSSLLLYIGIGKRVYNIVILLLFSMTFTLTSARFISIKRMLCCKRKQNSTVDLKMSTFELDGSSDEKSESIM